MKYAIGILTFVLLSAVSGTSAEAQISFGADIYSRYVWRGLDFGESLSTQPYLEYSSAGFTIGTWASYSISQDGSGSNEHDFYIGYSADLESGANISFGVTDYYFPSPGGAPFFDFDGVEDDAATGAHFIEPYFSVTGPESFPVSLYGSVFVHNDPDNSFYLEASVPLASTEEVELGLVSGFVLGESAAYGTNTLTLINLGLMAGREIKITESFSLPVSLGFVLNATPDNERTFLYFGFSL